jgi:transposase IS200 family protein
VPTVDGCQAKKVRASVREPALVSRLFRGMRPLRFIPHPQTLVEVTTRTIHSRLLLRPSPQTNEIFLGVLGRALALYPVGIVAATCLSGHYHLLLVVDCAKDLTAFMRHFNSNLAREIGRVVKWRDKFWSRRYRAIVVSDEEAAQVERLQYVLSQGVKEGLVEKAGQWPGVHCLKALLEGVPLVGQWFDRTREYAAQQRNENFKRLDCATSYQVQLSPLPW